VRTVFADTAYWIAVLNPRDVLHQKARDVSKQLGPVRIVTSEMVLTELLASFSSMGEQLRKAAAAYADRLLADPNVEVVPQTSIQFREALGLYQARLDKQWSLVDCASVQIMQQRHITEALTSDHHFQQAGFSTLLR
jgi:predicted nucleic acid-binding protein